MRVSHSVRFFDQQFQQQVAQRDFALNPFEQASLDYLRGTMLDLGCGLGNLSFEAARRGCRVTAIDASLTAIEHIRREALAEDLDVTAVCADLETWRADRNYDTAVAIGLLMFFQRERALALLGEIRNSVAPGGCAVVNVLIEGTTFLDMFEPGNYYLFGRSELEREFTGWKILFSRHDWSPAPGDTRKEFHTLVAGRTG